jgi:menaquinone-specific isochorismate synthase
VCWDDVRADVYPEAFARFTRLIAAGHLTKAVPVVLERGRLHGDPRAFAPALLARVLDAPDPSLAYAVWSDAAGMVGASPEVLFRRDARSVETVAMAGTYPLDRAERLVDDAKETREHQSVVDDLIEALGPLGTVTLGAREVVRLPFMAHLKTDIALRPFADPSFADLVRALHPTAALGVAPRSAGLTPLRDLETAPGRGRFGAPFGVEWPDRRAVVLVAIRNVQWSGDAVTLGAGAGLLAESRLDREWEELRLKRAAVKAMLGL